jgi:hypothetical protein
MTSTWKLWATRIATTLVAYGAICAIPFILAPILGMASAAALGYGPMYETAAAIIAILGTLIWDLRRRKARRERRAAEQTLQQ